MRNFSRLGQWLLPTTREIVKHSYKQLWSQDYILVITTAQQEEVLIQVLATLLYSKIPGINLKSIGGEFGCYTIHVRQGMKITVNIFSILTVGNLTILWMRVIIHVSTNFSSTWPQAPFIPSSSKAEQVDLLRMRKKKVFNDSLNYSTGLLHFAWVKNTPFYQLDSKSAIFRNVALNIQK